MYEDFILSWIYQIFNSWKQKITFVECYLFLGKTLILKEQAIRLAKKRMAKIEQVVEVVTENDAAF